METNSSSAKIPQLIFATGNQHKVDEIQSAIGDQIRVISLKQTGLDIDIPEPFDSLEENARGKSRTIFSLTGQNCFGEDTGLEVRALGGAPGVKSARYAGEGRDPSENIGKLLHEMNAITDRAARFRTVISLVWKGTEYQFEGICDGNILPAPRGAGGFGYDAVFIPAGSNRSFGEMSLEEKNGFSHRKKAAVKLVAFLSTAT